MDERLLYNEDMGAVLRAVAMAAEAMRSRRGDFPACRFVSRCGARRGDATLSWSSAGEEKGRVK